ncbi:MAG: hypothetical protein OXC93_15605, partial [Rhodospirillaceae bacterium]|nr:hypothetical protein [Rhodospirillaceae bacterium]
NGRCQAVARHFWVFFAEPTRTALERRLGVLQLMNTIKGYPGIRFRSCACFPPARTLCERSDI